MDKKVELSLETVNAIFSYLGTKPYQEVFSLINSIRTEAETSLQEIPKETEEE
jgi:hypothetical protein